MSDKQKGRNLGPQILNNSRGQALLEYTLLAVIIILICVGLLNQFFKPMGEFVSGPIKDYVQCLLERGEVPALGGSPSAECSLDKPNLAASSGSGSGGGKGGSSGKNGKDGDSGGDKANKSDKDGSGADAKNANSGSGGGGRGGSGSGSNMFSRKRPNSVAEGSGPGVVKSDDDESGNAQLQGSLQLRNGRMVVRRIAAKGYAGVLEREVEKAKKKEEKTRTLGKVSKKEAEEMGEGAKKRLLVKNTLKSQSTDLSSEEPMGFGKFIRIALIALLIIGFIIFMAMQLNSLSKEWDSSKQD